MPLIFPNPSKKLSASVTKWKKQYHELFHSCKLQPFHFKRRFITPLIIIDLHTKYVVVRLKRFWTDASKICMLMSKSVAPFRLFVLRNLITSGRDLACTFTPGIKVCFQWSEVLFLITKGSSWKLRGITMRRKEEKSLKPWHK